MRDFLRINLTGCCHKHWLSIREHDELHQHCQPARDQVGSMPVARGRSKNNKGAALLEVSGGGKSETHKADAASLFKLQAPYQPGGDQPKAIQELIEGVKRGDQAQVLLGITGSGKTFTMANVIAEIQKPTLIIAHNKILAAQLYGEFKDLFPENAVHYFVSYYDYYQPEAYVPTTDTFIEKDSIVNEEIDRMRHAEHIELLSRHD